MPKGRGAADKGIMVFFGDADRTGAAGEALGSSTDESTGRPAHQRLTARELEVLRLVAQGMTARQAAGILGISPRTVEQHKGRILAKLGVPNQAAALAAVLGDETLQKPPP